MVRSLRTQHPTEANRPCQRNLQPVPRPPIAPRKPATRTLHGRRRTDDYAWLKDENWQQVMRNPVLLRTDIRARLEAEAAYDCIAAYSPYDNVEAKEYPHIIATACLTDPRVTWWEPAKWVAKLRAMKTDDRLLLLHTNMEASHGGAAGRFDRLKETALVQAVVLHVFGIGTG